MYTSMDILIYSVDIKRGGSPDSNMNFYDQMVKVGKGWVEHEFVLFIICRIATWNKVAKWIYILQDTLDLLIKVTCFVKKVNNIFHELR
jgi:hypothetical protein